MSEVCSRLIFSMSKGAETRLTWGRQLVVVALASSQVLGCGRPEEPNDATTSEPKDTRAQTESSRPSDAAKAAQLVELVVDHANGCVRTDAGAIECWGPDFSAGPGQRARVSDWRTPQTIDLGRGAAKAVDIALADGVLCALFDDRQLACQDPWPKPELRSAPVQEGASSLWLGVTRQGGSWTCVGTGSSVECTPGPKALSGVVDIEAGELHTCALHEDASMTCWDPQHPDSPTHAMPSYRGGASRLGVEALELGGPCCVRTREGSLWCERDMDLWADCSIEYGVTLSELEARVIDVAISSGHMCRVDEGGEVWCRGANGFAQLGRGDSRSNGDGLVVEFVRVPVPAPAHALAVSASQSCALTSEGVWCWGTQDEALGPHLDEVASIDLAARRLHLDRQQSCAGTEGGLQCWGSTVSLEHNCCGGIISASEPSPAEAVRAGIDEYAHRTLLSQGTLTRGRVVRHLDNRDFQVDWETRGVLAFALNIDTLALVRMPRASLELWEEKGTLEPSMHRVQRAAQITGVSALSLGITEVCVVVAGGVRCRDTSAADAPWVDIPGIHDAIDVILHHHGGCARTSEGVSCWSDEDEVFAFAIPEPEQLVWGLFGVCVRTKAGAVQCGPPLLDDSSEWTTVIPSGALELAAGLGHLCARIDTNGDGVSERVECRGENNTGQLGELGEHVMLTPTRIELSP